MGGICAADGGRFGLGQPHARLIWELQPEFDVQVGVRPGCRVFACAVGCTWQDVQVALDGCAFRRAGDESSCFVGVGGKRRHDAGVVRSGCHDDGRHGALCCLEEKLLRFGLVVEVEVVEIGVIEMEGVEMEEGEMKLFRWIWFERRSSD